MRKKTSFKPFNDYFQHRILAYLTGQITQQKQLLQLVRSILPEFLANHTLHCLIRDEKLLVYTDAAVWASQLRFYHKLILANIKPLSRRPIETLQIKIISMPTGITLQPAGKKKIPSEKTVDLIRKHSLSISDKPLKQALLRLSSTLKGLSGKNRTP